MARALVTIVANKGGDSGEHNVKAYGAIGDGVTDDLTAFTNAISAAGGSQITIPSGTYILSNNLSIDSDITINIMQGAILSIASGKTITINSKIRAGLHQIFDGDGTVSIARGACEYLLPQWWGAIGDGVNDDTDAIQKALTASELKTKVVKLPPGTYLTTAPLTMRYGSKLIGSGKAVSAIKVTGGGNGISISRVVDSEIYEGCRVSDLRIYSTTTPVAGVGIYVNADRGVDIEDVWIGSWYPESSAYGYGFENGIEVESQPAYYTTIKRCTLFRNTYGIYINGGANESRILENEIWYSDYAVWVGGTQGIKITDNAFEGYTTCGVYTEGIESVIDSNRFESSGVQPIILGTTAKLAKISHVTNVTGLGNSDIVLDNSNYPNTHSIAESQIPIGNTNIGFSYPAGLLKSEYSGYYQSDMTIESLSGDLKVRSPLTKVVSVQSSLNVDKGEFSTSIGGMGSYVNNLCYYPHDVTQWWTGVGVTTRVANTEVAPDGTNTASSIITAADGDYISFILTRNGVGKLYQFSVWLKTDVAHTARFYLTKDNTPLAYKEVYVDTHWRRYHMNVACDAASTYLRIWLAPNSRSRTYVWGAQITEGTPVTGTDNSGVDNKTTKLVDTTRNFKTSGIDIGGQVMVSTGSAASIADITGINTILNFTTGDGTEPSIGDTITGGTSGATGTVAEVIVTSGTFAGGDATGTIEITPVTYTFTAENISWSGSTATVSSVNANCVLRGSFTSTYGNKTDVDNGNTYYAWNSVQRAPKPFANTGGSTTLVSTSPACVMPNALITGSISVANGYIHVGAVFNPMAESYTLGAGGEIVVANPNAEPRYLNLTNMQIGQVLYVENISSTYNLSVHYATFTVPPLHSAIIIKDTLGNLRSLGIFPSDLTPTSSPSFKRINGAVSALTNASTISCGMNNGNVFTLSTTAAVGNVQINATGGVAGQEATFIITDDGTGGHVVTFGTNFKSSGTLTGTANKTATVKFAYDGTNWYEVSRQENL